jgi:2-methylcitrate dehydratase PrpD
MNDVTRILARYLVKSRYEDIPQPIRHEAARALLNWLGCAIGGAQHETIDCMLQALTPFSGPAHATVIGRSERLNSLHAALVNGVASHVMDFDDTHARAIHPSAPVLPALLAYAEMHPVSGADLVHAFVLGVEAEERIGLSVFPEHYMTGWHITGTAGVFGAAAAIGKLLGLDEQRMCWALGIAATQSSGLREMFGSMCKSFHPGRAAQNGMTAALLAAAGFTSSEQAIEAPRGWAHVLSTKFDAAVITEGLGERYELAFNTYKPFACGLVVHAVIDGCIQLASEYGLTADSIERIDLEVNPIVLELTGKREPATGLEGKFSVYHAAAVAIVHRAAGEAQFSDECVCSPELVTLRRRVHAMGVDGLLRTQARIRIRRSNGTVLEKYVEHALGTLHRPLADSDLEAKFRGLTAGVLPDERTATLIDLCWNVANLDDAGAIARASARAG